MTSIISYNVNGIRSATKKGLIDWLASANPDILCLQELKADASQIDVGPLEELGYHCYWMPAEKKGYSGVGILSKTKPTNVAYGCNIGDYDQEGRVIRADYDDFSVMSLYIPSGSSKDERQAFKMKFLEDFHRYINELRQDFPQLVISGDYNICHKPIDIHNPVSNKNSSGFLPEEREWVSQFLDSGFTDTFRYFNEEPHQYSWWSFRANARQKNLGWRIDYHMASSEMNDRLRAADILADVVHSDHCPILLEIE